MEDVFQDRNINPWIILLSGPTSSGKTQLAQALQRHLSTTARPFLHIEADRIGLPHLPDTWDQDRERERFLRAFRHSVVSYIQEGYDIIVDGILPYGNPEEVEDALEQYREFRLCYVGVHCDLGTLEERVSRRHDRDIEFARRQFQDLHEGQAYDVEVNTTENGPEEAAAQVAKFLVYQDTPLKD